MPFKAYDRILRQRPILTQALSTGALFIAGDLLAQQAVERKGLKNHDPVRTMRLAAFGTCIAGPSIAMWYPFLQSAVTFQSPVIALSTRVVLDQTVFAPTFIGIFFSFNGFMEGKSLREVQEKLEKSWLCQLQ
ncbi:Protein required for ethanol metabolism [Phlyctochytrium planicorne]|nr:Protein required for ethanol metabolism [Phlyctochytrium planicorne]